MSQLDEVDTVTRGRAYLDSLAGRRVTVVGLAKSGVAAARLLRTAGADVIGTDVKPVAALGREAAALADLGVRLLAGTGETAAAFAGTELVVVSPGIPPDGAQLAAARARQVPIIGELELGWRAMEADTIAITGTNGKTTPPALIGAVLNADDEATRALGSRVRAPVVWFSRRRELAHGVFVRDGRIAARLNGHVEDICPLSEIFLRGQHNVENVLAATACALWTGVSPAAIRTAIGRFRGVAHRIEWVRDLAGVKYYNDSKGTNVDSTLRALESFAEPIVLIAGGKGKGQDFQPLAVASRGRVAHAVLIGEDAPKIGTALRDASVPVTFSQSLQEAVDRARALATPGSIVLLSPACASFDMFDNFEHRGEVFKKIVERLD